MEYLNNNIDIRLNYAPSYVIKLMEFTVYTFIRKTSQGNLKCKSIADVEYPHLKCKSIGEVFFFFVKKIYRCFIKFFISRTPPMYPTYRSLEL